MTHRYWPLFDLRLQRDRIMLRPIVEADLVRLSDLRPADAETDPRLPTFGIADRQLAAGVATHRAYWSSLGTWRPEAWRLGFAGAPSVAQCVSAGSREPAVTEPGQSAPRRGPVLVVVGSGMGGRIGVDGGGV